MNKYDDIIKLPHHVSKRHPQMSIMARSAQFAPFAALSGYDEAVKETARLTDKRIEIDDGLKLIINNKLNYILENLNINPQIIFTYFVYDSLVPEFQSVTIPFDDNRLASVYCQRKQLFRQVVQ